MVPPNGLELREACRALGGAERPAGPGGVIHPAGSSGERPGIARSIALAQKPAPNPTLAPSAESPVRCEAYPKGALEDPACFAGQRVVRPETVPDCQQ
jgi:hypothetical protein